MRKLNENRLRKGVVDMGGVASAPTFVALTVRSIAFFIAAVGRYFVFLGKVSNTRIHVLFSSTQVGHLIRGICS